jgi:hypothetical protein
MNNKDYWDYKEEGRKIYWDLTRKMRGSQNAARRHGAEARQLGDEIARRERSGELKTLLDRMLEEKAFILDQISRCPAVVKDRWYQCLDSIILMDPAADARLKDLLEEVGKERRLRSGNIGSIPEEWQSLLGKDRWLSTEPQSSQKKGLSPYLSAVELELEQREKERETERKLVESRLALIVSSLNLLITRRNQYRAAL